MKLSLVSEEFSRHELEVRTWFAEKNGFAHLQKSNVTIINETVKINKDTGVDEGAYRLAFEKEIDSKYEKFPWVPKSLCKIIKREEVSLSSF